MLLKFDSTTAARNAQLVCGFIFCLPSWQGAARLPDDIHKQRNYRSIPSFMRRERDVLLQEISEIRNWYESGTGNYHIYKMLRADSYIL